MKVFIVAHQDSSIGGVFDSRKKAAHSLREQGYTKRRSNFYSPKGEQEGYYDAWIDERDVL